MVDLTLVFELRTAWRNVDTPFYQRCQSIEPVIDRYLAEGSRSSESDRLGQGRRLVQTAGLEGPLGPFFGQHVVRCTAHALALASPRFNQARALVGAVCQWPNLPLPGASLHAAPNREADQWAVLLAAQADVAQLDGLTRVWQKVLQSLAPPPEASATPRPLLAHEHTRLIAIHAFWQNGFGRSAGNTALAMRPPDPKELARPGHWTQAQAVLEIWAPVRLPRHGWHPGELKRQALMPLRRALSSVARP